LSDKQLRHLLKNLNLCEDFTVDWEVLPEKQKPAHRGKKSYQAIIHFLKDKI